MTNQEMADRLRRAKDGTEFEYKGWTLLVLDYAELEERQVKVCLDREFPDRGAFWLDVDEHLEDELGELAATEDDPVYGEGP